jgi:hypothetical protein
MNLADKMKELTTDCLYDDIENERKSISLEILKESILKEIEHSARQFFVSTDREFNKEIPLETRKELCKYLESEGFASSLLNNNQTISVYWG